jgi:hypothetical protein
MKIAWLDTVLIFVLMGIMSIVGNSLGYNNPVQDSAVGYLIMMIITLIGMAFGRYIPIKLPMVFWISVVAVLSTSSFSPFSQVITFYTNKMDFLALTTPILAYAGLAVGKDLKIFQRMSWRIVVVALAVYTGTFVFATLVAQIMLHFEGII